MIAKDKLPASFVEGEGFRALMKFLARSYKVPCRQTITNKLRGRFGVLMGITKGRLAVAPHFAVTADLWTDLNQRSYLGKSTLLSSDELDLINFNF